REAHRDVIPARACSREAMARHALRKCGAGYSRRHLARNSRADRDQSNARLDADPDDDARRDRLRSRRRARRGGESDPAARDADPAEMGRRLAFAIRRIRLRALHQKQDHAVEGGEMTRALYSYQNRAATFFYERDAAFLVAPLGAGKGA